MKILLNSSNNIMIDLPETAKIFELKKNIFNNSNIPIQSQILQFSGKILDDNSTLEDYSIDNNSTIFLTTKLLGGAVKGFPNIGNMIMLFIISMASASVIYYIFFMMMKTILFHNLIVKDCTNLKATMDSFLSSITKGFVFPIIRPQVGGLTNNWQLFFTLAVCFYLSLMVAISATFLSTFFCKHQPSYWIFVAAITTLPILFIINILLYRIRTKYLKMTMNTTFFINIGAFILASLILLILMIFVPMATDTSKYSLWTYAFPIGISIAIILFFTLNGISKLNNFIQILIYLGIFLVFVVIPYILFYVYNNFNLCKETS